MLLADHLLARVSYEVLDDWLRAERELLDEEAVGEISSVPNGPGETGDISQIAALREQVTQA